MRSAGIYHQPVSFPNEDFGRALRHAYLGTATSSEPTAVGIITPLWPEYNYGGAHTEMLFNKTEDGKVDIRAFQTDPGLRKRCEYVFMIYDSPNQELTRSSAFGTVSRSIHPNEKCLI